MHYGKPEATAMNMHSIQIMECNIAFVLVNQSIWENGAYEFGIYNDNGKTSPNDIKVKQTIISVIEEFFINNPDILLYQCETGDNKQNARQRLFYKWFNDSPNRDKYVLKVSSIIAEDTVNFIALIVNRKFALFF